MVHGVLPCTHYGIEMSTDHTLCQVQHGSKILKYYLKETYYQPNGNLNSLIDLFDCISTHRCVQDFILRNEIVHQTFFSKIYSLRRQIEKQKPKVRLEHEGLIQAMIQAENAILDV